MPVTCIDLWQIVRVSVGIDDDDVPTEEATSTSVPDEIPPLEGDGDDDASRMEEVD